LKDLKEKNNQIKELKLILKQSPRQTLIQIENILNDVQDKKSFIFLLDAHETEKEITRELLEDLIEKSTELNDEIIEVLEKKYSGTISGFINQVFAPENFKSLVIGAIVIGLLISIATNDDISLKILNTIDAEQHIFKQGK